MLDALLTVPNLGKCLAEVVAEVIKIIGEERWDSMIDEKKLIEELKERERTHMCDFNVFDDAPEAQFDVAHCLQELQEVMDIVRKQPKVGEWIPCSERLPIGEEYKKKIKDEWFYKKVLTTEEGGMHIGWYDQEDECWYDNQGFAMHPVAWQFLPQPYNAERGGKNE